MLRLFLKPRRNLDECLLKNINVVTLIFFRNFRNWKVSWLAISYWSTVFLKIGLISVSLGESKYMDVLKNQWNLRS